MADAKAQLSRELHLARAALAAGDAAHASHHAAAAIGLGPLDGDARLIIDSLVDEPLPGVKGKLQEWFGRGPKLARSSPTTAS